MIEMKPILNYRINRSLRTFPMTDPPIYKGVYSQRPPWWALLFFFRQPSIWMPSSDRGLVRAFCGLCRWYIAN